ncbi:MAG: hypothetical protein AAGA12_00935 [Pseudomonadota bacterium]
MIATAAIAWVGPMIIACFVGLWMGKRPASSAAEFGTAMMFATLWCAMAVFMLHMIWLGALMMSDGGIAQLGSWAWYWTWVTGFIWVPIMVIAYILRARREMRQ